MLQFAVPLSLKMNWELVVVRYCLQFT